MTATSEKEGEIMAIEVNTNRYTGVRKITIKNHDGSTAGTITIHDSKLKNKKSSSINSSEYPLRSFRPRPPAMQGRF